MCGWKTEGIFQVQYDKQEREFFTSGSTLEKGFCFFCYLLILWRTAVIVQWRKALDISAGR